MRYIGLLFITLALSGNVFAMGSQVPQPTPSPSPSGPAPIPTYAPTQADLEAIQGTYDCGSQTVLGVASQQGAGLMIRGDYQDPMTAESALVYDVATDEAARTSSHLVFETSSSGVVTGVKYTAVDTEECARTSSAVPSYSALDPYPVTTLPVGSVLKMKLDGFVPAGYNAAQIFEGDSVLSCDLSFDASTSARTLDEELSVTTTALPQPVGNENNQIVGTIELNSIATDTQLDCDNSLVRTIGDLRRFAEANGGSLTIPPSRPFNGGE